LSRFTRRNVAEMQSVAFEMFLERLRDDDEPVWHVMPIGEFAEGRRLTADLSDATRRGLVESNDVPHSISDEVRRATK